jgi:DNA-binding NarL/FixJ family response regulator
MPYDVLLVEDHRIVRDGIRAILEREPDFRVTGETDSGVDAIQFCKRAKPHLVLMDVGLPGLGGVDAAAEILRHSPETKIVVVSMLDDEESVAGALLAGVRGFVLKKASLADLVEAMRTVVQGGTYLSPEVSDKLLHRMQTGNFETRPLPEAVRALSRRELQVMRLVADGKTSREIATMLDLGLQTVRSYRKTMMRKLGLNNVAGLTQLAVSVGLSGMQVRAAAEE